MKFKTNQLKELILKRLVEVENTALHEFSKNKKNIGTGYLIIDNLLPQDIAMEITQAFNEANPAWREMSSFREKKLTSKNFDSFDKILGEITFAFQETEVLKAVERITQIWKLIGDPGLYAGGLSMMRKGDFLDPHIDNSHDQSRQHYRRLNLLYYVSPQWKTENGGHLELWNQKVLDKVTIESKFNRLVLMETHNLSWHSVSPVIKETGLRKCVSNYYFSKESPLGYEYFHVTSFNGRPENQAKRIFCKVDNFIRSRLRSVKSSGFGKTDLYQGK